jgi:serine/threonine-protein kinase
VSNTIDAYGNPINSFNVGQVLLGKYRIDRVLGQGGMGIVLGATHVELEHRVAIKLLLPNLPGSELIEARFLREAQALASLRSEHVVRVFDVGRLENGCPYMVMEWLEGRDLSSGPMGPSLPIEEAVDYVVQACDAMIVAHHRNLVHRDLKPANLFLVHDEHGDPKIKVLDFGISKLNHSGTRSLALTDANGVMGSPLYMSPEQVRSAKDVDCRADIWSLGTILFELISGEPPFGGESLGAVFLALANQPPEPLRNKRPDVPPALETVILRCLEKDPNARFQSALDLQRALLPFASLRSQAKIAMRSSSAPPRLVSTSPIAPATTARTTGGWTDLRDRDGSRFSSRKHLWLAGSVVTFTLGAGAAALIYLVPRQSISSESVSTVSSLNSAPHQASQSPNNDSPTPVSLPNAPVSSVTRIEVTVATPQVTPTSTKSTVTPVAIPVQSQDVTAHAKPTRLTSSDVRSSTHTAKQLTKAKTDSSTRLSTDPPPATPRSPLEIQFK